MAALDAAASLEVETGLGLSLVHPFHQHSGGVGRNRVIVRGDHLLIVFVVVVVVVDIPPVAAVVEVAAGGSTAGRLLPPSATGTLRPGLGLRGSTPISGLAQGARRPGQGSAIGKIGWGLAKDAVRPGR